MHLGIRPVREVEDFESAREAFSESALHQERRRAEEHHPYGTARLRVFVPQALHGL